MARLHGGHLAVRGLLAEQVRVVFTVSGGVINPIYDACIGTDIRLVHTRHEAAAVYMADAWARLTREPGVALLTLGAGVATGVAGLLTAFLASSPVVVLAGRAALGRAEMRPFSEFDQVGVVRPITKWARTLPETRRIPEYLSTAFRQALCGRPGPVFLDFPADLLAAEVEEHEVRFPARARPGRPQGDPQLVDAAAALVAAARRPVVLAGSGVWWSEAVEELRELLETAGLPLFAERMARGALPPGHPLSLGVGAVQLNPALAAALRESDLLVIAGGRIDYLVEYGRPPIVNPHAKVVQIDIEPEEIGHNRDVDVGIVGDARAVLRQLVAALRQRPAPPDRAAWVERLQAERRQAEAALAPLLESAEVPIHPLRLCAELRRIIDRETIVITSGGDIEQWGRWLLEPHAPGQYLRAGQTGALGVDVPYAVAAQLAHPEKRVVVLTGDGGIGYAAMELDTAARHGLPIVCVVANDGCWAQIKHQQELSYGPERVIAMDLPPRPYEQIAEALGGYGERVTRPEDLGAALRRALRSGRPALVNVLTRPAVSPETEWPYRLHRELGLAAAH